MRRLVKTFSLPSLSHILISALNKCHATKLEHSDRLKRANLKNQSDCFQFSVMLNLRLMDYAL